MRRAQLFAVSVATMFVPILSACAGEDEEFPPGIAPQLARPGDWAADFNDAMLQCYNGSMVACDSIWLSRRVLSDTFLSGYGRTCGGRVSLEALREAGAFRIQGPSLHCIEIFPDHQ